MQAHKRSFVELNRITVFCKERDCLFGLCGLFERIRLTDIENQRAVIRDIADYFFELFIRILVERIDSHILDEYTGVAAHHRKSLDRLLDIFEGTRRAVEEMIIEIRKIGTDGFILELRGIEFLEIALRSENRNAPPISPFLISAFISFSPIAAIQSILSVKILPDGSTVILIFPCPPVAYASAPRDSNLPMTADALSASADSTVKL